MAHSHIEIAKQLKQNSAEIREYFEDLYQWQDELKEKEYKEKKKKTDTLKNCKCEENKETYYKGADLVNKNNCYENKKKEGLLAKDLSTADTCNRTKNVEKTDELKKEGEEINAKVSNAHEEITNIEKKDVNMMRKKEEEFDYEIKDLQEIEKLKNESIFYNYPKIYEIYISKNEENKMYFQKKNYTKCLECCNDIINYIDYELGNNNIFVEIEKNWENELYIEIISSNFSFDKKTEELYILRTKCLINRSLVYHKLSSFFESIKDNSCVVLFYQHFLSHKKECEKYVISNVLAMNIKYIIFKSYYLRGTARYKLKIYKASLKDFEKSKEFLGIEKNNTNISNVNKSIQLVQNIINENKVKKHSRRQHEYTATLLEQFQLKPRLLEIEIIPRGFLKQLPTINTKVEVKKAFDKEKQKRGKTENMENTPSKEKKEKGNMEEDVLINDENNFESDSSLTLSGDSILTDIEETKPIIIPSGKKNAQIKNKINFELLWNSNKIKKSCKEQIILLKTAFLEEGIFHFHLDKDMYVDILDTLFKNNFLNLFENYLYDNTIKDVLKNKYNGNFKKSTDIFESKEIANENDITYSDYVFIIDILYSMTNFGKDNFIFLFIDKKERILFMNFFNFMLNNSKKFFCNENCIKHKTSIMKKLLEMATEII